MNKPQVIELAGKNYVVLTEAEYEELTDLANARLTASRIRDGREEYYPEELVAEIIAGANPVRTFREYRRLTASEVARQAGVNQSYISEIENGRKPGSASALKRIAQALRVEMELLISDDG